MRLTNDTGFPAAWTMGFERDGREMVLVAIKATYTIPPLELAPEMAAEQVPLTEADEFTGEPGLSAPLYETDFAPRKPACDVLLIGHAYPPEGRPVARVPVGLRVGSMTKRFAVVGDRVWRKVFGVSASKPEPFRQIPITYDVAFGGTDPTHEQQGKVETFRANPVGKGYRRNFGDIDGQPLPNTEELDRAVDDPQGDYPPMAFSPVGRSWIPRAGYVGTYDEAWMENTAPFWPDDFDYRYFQAAPSDQIIPYPSGNEEVILRNLTPDGYRAFRLPGQKMPVTFIPHRGRDVTVQSNVDTIVLEPSSGRFTLTWRANLPLGKSVFDVKEVIVGEMSEAWHRARRSPGKPYFRGLEELAKHRQSRSKP